MCCTGFLFDFIVFAGNKHDDGTQSDSENTSAYKHYNKRAAIEDQLRHHHKEQQKLHVKTQDTERHPDQPAASQTAFMIEFFDDSHPRKRRSYSFSQNVGVLCPETSTLPAPHARTEKGRPASGDLKGSPSALQTSCTQQKAAHAKLLKQKSEDPSTALPFLQTSLLRSSGSLGHRPDTNDNMGEKMKSQVMLEKDDDDQSDKGTYTIELENPTAEEIEARKMIDKVRLLNWFNIGMSDIWYKP